MNKWKVAALVEGIALIGCAIAFKPLVRQAVHLGRLKVLSDLESRCKQPTRQAGQPDDGDDQLHDRR